MERYDVSRWEYLRLALPYTLLPPTAMSCKGKVVNFGLRQAILSAARPMYEKSLRVFATTKKIACNGFLPRRS